MRFVAKYKKEIIGGLIAIVAFEYFLRPIFHYVGPFFSALRNQSPIRQLTAFLPRLRSVLGRTQGLIGYRFSAGLLLVSPPLLP